MLHSRLEKVIFATFDPKFGCCGSIYNHLEDGKFNHTIKVFSGLMENESQYLLRNFFQKLRN
ncbi:hypothetical protein MASR1M107_05070 [Ignavibacteriales bacterium]